MKSQFDVPYTTDSSSTAKHLLDMETGIQSPLKIILKNEQDGSEVFVIANPCILSIWSTVLKTHLYDKRTGHNDVLNLESLPFKSSSIKKFFRSVFNPMH